MHICIFSGAALPHSEDLHHQVIKLVQFCAENNHTIVNGGTGVGMMQLVGTTALNAGGKVLAIYPMGMATHESQSHASLTHLSVKNLHERLEKMTDNSDCFIALPGGIGTLHEIFQVWADTSLAYHKKPLHIFNFEGYFTALQTLIAHAVESGYISPARAKLATFHPTLESLLEALSS